MKFSMMLMAWPGHHDDQDNKPNPEEGQPDHEQKYSYSCQVQNWTEIWLFHILDCYGVAHI